MKRLAIFPILLICAGCPSPIESLERVFIFHPSRQITLTPQDAGLAAEDVSIPVGGETVHGWYFPAAKEMGRHLLYLHGNGGNISNRLELIRFLQPLNLNLLIIDYRGYGQSGGEPGVDAFLEDSMAAVDWMISEKKAPPGQIFVWGHSLGAAAALAVAAKKPQLAGVIVESGFVSLKRIAALRAAWAPDFIVRDKLDNLSIVKALPMPKLIIHGDMDALIPFSHGQELANTALEPKEFYIVRGGAHSDNYIKGGAEYLARVERWMAAHGGGAR